MKLCTNPRCMDGRVPVSDGERTAPCGDCRIAALELEKRQSFGQLAILGVTEERARGYVSHGIDVYATRMRKEVAALEAERDEVCAALEQAPHADYCSYARDGGEPCDCYKSHGWELLDDLRDRVAALERSRSALDCRYAKQYAETSGSHCPLNKPCERCQRDQRIAALEAENATLAAGQCVVDGGLLGDEHGHQYCAVQRRLQAAERRAEETKSRFLYTANASQVDMHGWRACAVGMYEKLLEAPNECPRNESTEQRIAELKAERDKAAQDATVAESMCAVHEQEIPELEEQVQVLSDEISRLREELNDADARYAALLEQNGQACVRAEKAEDRAESAEKRAATWEQVARDREPLRRQAERASVEAEEALNSEVEKLREALDQEKLDAESICLHRERWQRLVNHAAELWNGGVVFGDDDRAVDDAITHMDGSCNEVARLKAGGCARDQRLTQHCALAEKALREIGKAVAREREACAVLCDFMARAKIGAKTCAATIRARADDPAQSRADAARI